MTGQDMLFNKLLGRDPVYIEGEVQVPHFIRDDSNKHVWTNCQKTSGK